MRIMNYGNDYAIRDVQNGVQHVESKQPDTKAEIPAGEAEKHEPENEEQPAEAAEPEKEQEAKPKSKKGKKA